MSLIFKNVLAVGAHPDDIEYSCLGFLLKQKNSGANISTFVVSLGSSNDKTSERNADLPSFIRDNMGNVTSKNTGINYTVYPNGRLDEDWYFLGDIENQDWWDSLDDDVKREFVKYFG